MNKCLECSKQISEKAKYCSDKCRMAYTRKLRSGFSLTQPEQQKPPRTLHFGPTRTDLSFEKYSPHYFNFDDEIVYESNCIICGKDFKSHLKLLKVCSPKCQQELTNSLRTDTGAKR